MLSLAKSFGRSASKARLMRPSATLVQHEQRRHLDLHEYQSKQILHDNGVRVQKFKVASSHEEIDKVIYPEQFGHLKKDKWSGFEEDISKTREFVVKAQVLAGGRGKGRFVNSGLVGGVKITSDRNKAESYAKYMLNDYIVTKQTTADGVLVKKVMIAEAVRLKKEYYLAIVLDRSYDFGPILIASPYGGVDIEEIAAKSDTAIRRMTIPIDMAIDMDTARKMAAAGFDLSSNDMGIINQCAEQIQSLYAMFLTLDANQIEINPLGVTDRNEVIAVDAKIAFDENAKFRQQWINELESMNSEDCDKLDRAARDNHLNYIRMEGSIGCLVNGAGLAMATMDIIKLHGGEPANFLDIGGGANAKQTLEALRIISSDPRVRSILINIFGGITRCDLIAQGIVDAMKELKITLPIVCRLQGTEVEAARRILESASISITSLDDLDQAAKHAVEQAASG